MFDSYLMVGLIELSITESSFPLVMVPKQDGTIRITVNCGRLNAVVVVGKCLRPQIYTKYLTLSGKIGSSPRRISAQALA